MENYKIFRVVIKVISDDHLSGTLSSYVRLTKPAAVLTYMILGETTLPRLLIYGNYSCNLYFFTKPNKMTLSTKQPR